MVRPLLRADIGAAAESLLENCKQPQSCTLLTDTILSVHCHTGLVVGEYLFFHECGIKRVKLKKKHLIYHGHSASRASPTLIELKLRQVGQKHVRCGVAYG